MGTVIVNEGFTIAFCALIGTFSIGWMIYGIGWIRRTAKSFTPKPVKRS